MYETIAWDIVVVLWSMNKYETCYEGWYVNGDSGAPTAATVGSRVGEGGMREQVCPAPAHRAGRVAQRPETVKVLCMFFNRNVKKKRIIRDNLR